MEEFQWISRLKEYFWGRLWKHRWQHNRGHFQWRDILLYWWASKCILITFCFHHVLLESPNVLWKNCLDKFGKKIQNAHFCRYCPRIWKGICPVLWLGSIVFLTGSATATIICFLPKTENLFIEKNSFHFDCVWGSVTLLPKCYLSEDPSSRIVIVFLGVCHF